MTLTQIRERRRYRPVAPDAAWLGGRAPRPGRVRKRAIAQLADALGRYMEKRPPAPEDVGAWVRYAAQVGAGLPHGPAPDGTDWHVITVIDYV